MFEQSARSAFLAGAWAIAPVLVGALPFGMVVGIVASEVGFSIFQTMFASIFLYAGAAQLVVMELFSKDTILWVIVLSASIVNLRFVMYSAAMTDYFKQENKVWKFLLSFSLIDQVYALCQAQFDTNPDFHPKKWYAMGLSVPIWVVWHSGTVAGYFLGPIIPESWSLSFIIPLMFLALLVPAIKGVPYLAAAVVSAVTIMLTQNFPNGTGLMVAALCGIVVGFMLDGRTAK